jgi:membrane-bound ClpP family serine protease
MKEMYIRDFKVEKNLAWLLTCSVPIILYLLGMHNFIVVITVLGALISVVEGTAIILMYKKVVNPNKAVSIVGYFIVLLFVIGFIYVLADVI